MTKVLPLSRWAKHDLPHRDEYSDEDSEDESSSDEEPIAPTPVFFRFVRSLQNFRVPGSGSRVPTWVPDSRLGSGIQLGFRVLVKVPGLPNKIRVPN